MPTRRFTGSMLAAALGAALLAAASGVLADESSDMAAIEAQRAALGKAYMDGNADAARRLRVGALLYAAVFVIVGPLTALSSGAADRHAFFTNPMRAGASLIAITAALLVAASTRRAAALRPRTVLIIGLLFEVVGSYGIAAARYLDPAQQATAPPVVAKAMPAKITAIATR